MRTTVYAIFRADGFRLTYRYRTIRELTAACGKPKEGLLIKRTSMDLPRQPRKKR